MVSDHGKAYITEERFAPDMSKCDLAFCLQPEDLLGHKHYHRMPFYAMSYFDKALELTGRARVTVGEGAVIGANSLVNKDVPEYEIWAGSPARKIGER